MTVVIYDAMRRASLVTHWSGMVIPWLMVIGCYIVPTFWLGWHLTQMLGERVGRLYWPKETVTPPPLYYLIELYLSRGDLDKALFEYEKILYYHPDEIQAHVGRLEVMVAVHFTPSKIEKAYLKSFKALKRDEDRNALNACYTRYLQTVSSSRDGIAHV